MIERLSTDIEWSVEIHISNDDRSGSSTHRFIIITDNFIEFIVAFPYVSQCPRFKNILAFLDSFL